jgi:hypothetical protein
MMHSDYDGCKNNYGIDHGDIIEGICVDDPRYDGLTTEANVYQQMQQAMRNRARIADKLLVIMEGNHPLKLWRFFGPSKPGLTETVCKDIGVNYGTWSCVLEYKTLNGKGLHFRHFATHGAGTFRSVADDPKRRYANIKLSLKKKLKGKVGDCLLMSCGHAHTMIYCEPEPELYMQTTGNKLKGKYTGPKKVDGYIHPDYRHYLCCGSFYKIYAYGHSGYAEIAGYDPVQLGFWITKVRDRKIVGIDPVELN